MPGGIHAKPTLALDVGRLIERARRIIGMSQRDLGRRAGVAQTAISRVERGLPSGLGIEGLERIAATLGGLFQITLHTPFLADRARQRDRVHARCIAFVAGRLRHLGWEVATEVEIAGQNGPGWIDLLAYNAALGILLVIEIKTEIHDLGRIQRTLAWYERRAWAAARERGWRPRASHASLILLATDAVDARLRENREIVAEAFPSRSTDLAALVDRSGGPTPAGWSVAMVDPLSRRRDWLRPIRLDGRRSQAPYEDYAAAARRLESNRIGREVVPRPRLP